MGHRDGLGAVRAVPRAAKWVWPVVAGAGTGLVGGIALGAVEGPVGMLVGLVLGATVGVIAGSVLGNEERRRDARSRELDEIIGVTSGDLGAAPVRPSLTPGDDPELSYEPWGADLLTPPPPAAT